MTTRRDLLIVLSIGALTPLTVFAQSKRPVLIGWLSTRSRESDAHFLTAFKDELAALRGKVNPDYVVEERWADGRADRLPIVAGELAAKRPAVIVASLLVAASNAAKAAPNTPIVLVGGDPVASGLARSLARPGGTVTGVTTLSIAVSEKYLELLLAAAPSVRQVGFLIDSVAPLRDSYAENARRSAARHSVDAHYAEVDGPETIERAISVFAKEGMQALVVLPGPTMSFEGRRIAKLALAHRWPAIGGRSEFAEEGGLLSYGADRSAMYRRAAYYVDRILKGAKPSDLPIEQPTKFELVVNMKTAKALGLTLPQLFLMRADRVIE